MGSIAIIGDCHGKFKSLNSILLRLSVDFPEVDTVIQVGDFGYWPRIGSIGHWLNSLRVPEGMTLYWIDGNHEDFKAMKNFGMMGKPNNLKRFKDGQVFYVPRGSVLNLGGYNILFMGGAESIDALHRKKDVDWFSEESITDQDVADALASIEGQSIDIVISHDAPRSFSLYKLDLSMASRMGWDKWEDPSRDKLETIRQAIEPQRWFFGHYHTSMFGEFGPDSASKWRCLDINEFYILENKHEMEETTED